MPNWYKKLSTNKKKVVNTLGVGLGVSVVGLIGAPIYTKQQLHKNWCTNF